MATEDIGSIVLISLFFITVSYVIYDIIDYKRNKKKICKKIDIVIKDIENLYNDFLKIYYDSENEEVKKTRWAEKLFNKFKKRYSEDYICYGLWPDKDYEWYEKQEKELRSLFNEFYLNLNKIKEEIKNNKFYWNDTITKLNNFFVAIPIGSNEEFYCFTTKININEFNNLETIVFTEREKSGKKNIITPYTHKLRNMTESEFKNKFIMDRMNVMDFNNEKKALEYYEYMINKFKNN